MKQWCINFVLAVLLSFSTLSSQAEMYRYSDGKGHTLTTNRPIKNRKYDLVWGPSKGKTGLYRYKDENGNTLLADKLIENRNYRLVWRSSIGKIDSGKRSSKSKVNKKLSWQRISRKKYRWQHKEKYEPIIKQVAQKVALPPALIHAVVQAESAYNPKAKSSAGAIGLMQLMPATASRYGVANIWDPSQNLEGGAQYLRDLLAMFKNNLKLALAAYNAGEGAVKKYGNRIPPYPETQNYVRKVISFYLVERQRQRS